MERTCEGLEAFRVFVEANPDLPDDEVVSLCTWDPAWIIPHARMKLTMRDFRLLVEGHGKKARKLVCWKKAGGTPCLLDRDHGGWHADVMAGRRWGDLELDAPEGTCGAPLEDIPFGGPVCTMPLNHDGGHSGKEKTRG